MLIHLSSLARSGQALQSFLALPRHNSHPQLGAIFGRPTHIVVKLHVQNSFVMGTHHEMMQEVKSTRCVGKAADIIL